MKTSNQLQNISVAVATELHSPTADHASPVAVATDSKPSAHSLNSVAKATDQ
jgi:hypothetical protein